MAATASNPAGGENEVYVAARPFTSIGGSLMQRLSPQAKNLMVDAGVCHYMTIVREPSGKLTMYDFGPIGGDIAVVPCIERAATVQEHAGVVTSVKEQKRRQKAIQGEIRVTHLNSLPDTSMYVGTTTHSAADIERFNDTRSTVYQLNVNDCRHYTNRLVQQATGIDGVAARLVRHQFRNRRSHSLRPVDHLFHPIQTLTNADNWHAIQLSAYSAAAVAVATVGHPFVGPPLATCSAFTWSHMASVAAKLACMSRKATGAAAHGLLQKQRALVSASSAAVTASAGLARRETDRTLASLSGVSLGRRAAHRVSHSLAGVSHALSGASNRMVHGLSRRARAVQWRAQLPRRAAGMHRTPPLGSLTMRAMPQHRASVVGASARAAPQCAARSSYALSSGPATVVQRSCDVPRAPVPTPLRQPYSKQTFGLTQGLHDIPHLRRLSRQE